jgi:Tfp pilus assembly PilM family ATPase
MPRRQPKSSCVVGLSLSDTSTQAVELRVEERDLTLHALAEWRGGLQEQPASAVLRLAAFMTANSVTAQRIAVTVDTAALFTHILPVPASQSSSLLQTHGRWDLAQFFPENAESDFITDVQLLGNDADGDHRRALCVAVRRDVSRDIQQALEAEGLELQVLDGDQFSAEHYLTSRHPEGCNGTVMLLGIKQGRLDLSVLLDGTLTNYGAWNDTSTEACAAKIAENEALHGEIRRVFLFGPRATARAAESLGALIHPAVELLNPFAGMSLALRSPLAEHFLQTPQRFVPAVGVALREE